MPPSRITQRAACPTHPIALIGDIVASRDLADRAATQVRLMSVLASENERHAGSLLAPMTITAGDEFQGLFQDATAAVEVLMTVTETMHPVTLSFGLGCGGLTTPLPDDPAANTVATLDGPVFHHARDAIQASRSEGSGFGAARGFGDQVDALATAILDLLGVLRNEWTDKQAHVIAASRGAAQKSIAADLDVSPSVISERLKAAHVGPWRRAEAALITGLQGAAP